MHCWIELDSQALVNNYQIFSKLLGKDQLAIVLKSNAYGHGLEAVYKSLQKEAPAIICVAYLEEAQAIRRLGYAGRIILVTPIESTGWPDACRIGAEVIVGHPSVLEGLLAMQVDRPQFHIKVDTGLSRRGLTADELPAAIKALQVDHKGLIGICTHFANVEDVLEHEYADKQLERFRAADKKFQDAGIEVERHAASSASALILPAARSDFARVGVSLYGFWPSQSTRLSFLQREQSVADLKPALSWKTRVAEVKQIQAGDYVGYGCTFRAPAAMTIAVLPVGYYEGYPRLAGNDQSYVLIDGSRCPLIGRISMNMMVVDVTHLARVSPGDEVVLIGSSGEESVSAEHVAAWAETIHYELVARLHPAIPRKIV